MTVAGFVPAPREGGASATVDHELLDVEIDSEQDERPERYAEHRREDSLGVAEVGKVVVRVRHDQAHNHVDRDEEPAPHDSLDEKRSHVRANDTTRREQAGVASQ
jgi:hypothetical protein